MEIFNRKYSKNTGQLEILTSFMLISPQNSSARNLSIQVSDIPVGSEQPIHAHGPEQCYYLIRSQFVIMALFQSAKIFFVHKKPPARIVSGCATLSYLFTGGFFFCPYPVTYPICSSSFTLWGMSYPQFDI
jgi:hypothetical protein